MMPIQPKIRLWSQLYGRQLNYQYSQEMYKQNFVLMTGKEGERYVTKIEQGELESI